MGLSIADAITAGHIPARPNPVNNGDRLQWDIDAREYYRQLCRDHVRTTDIYVDSVAGDDGNSGLTIGDPLQTLTAALALLDDDVRINLKAGSVFKNEAATLDHAGCALVRYGEGANPLLWRSQLISGTWTQAGATNRWSKTVSESDTAIVLQGDPDDPAQIEWMIDHPYQRVFSTAACEAAPGTYYQSLTTLHIHTYGSLNPNTLELHRIHQTLTLPSANGIRLTNVDLVYVNGIDVMGFGAVSGQIWLIRSEAGGTNVHAIENCRPLFSSSFHVFGHYGNAGGIVVWKDITYGYCVSEATGGTSTGFIDFGEEGGQTCFFHDCRAIGGQLDYNSNGSGTAATYKHLPSYFHLGGTPTDDFGYMSSIGHIIETRAGNKIGTVMQTDGATLAVPTDKFDLDQYACVIFDEEYREGEIATGNFIEFAQVPGTIRIGGTFGRVRCVNASSDPHGAILNRCEGLFVNHTATFVVDPAYTSYFSIWYGASTNYRCRPGLIYSHWEIEYEGDPTGGSNGRGFSVEGGAQAVHLVASVLGFSNPTSPTSATYPRNNLAFAPNGAPTLSGSANPTGGQIDCAYYRIRATNNSTWLSFHTSTDPLDLTATHGIHSIEMGVPPLIDSPLVGHAVNVPSHLRFTHDANGVIRWRDTAGPLEVTPPGGGAIAALLLLSGRRRRLKAMGVAR